MTVWKKLGAPPGYSPFALVTARGGVEDLADTHGYLTARQ